MSLNIRAAINVEKHLEIEHKEAEQTTTLFFNPKITSSIELYEALYDQLEKIKVASVHIDTFIECGFSLIDKDSVIAIVAGLVEHFSKFPIHFKSKNVDKKDIKLVGNTKPSSEISNLIEAQSICKRLQELPPNMLKPKDFVKEIQALFKGTDVSVEIFSNKELLDKNLNLIHAVGRAHDDCYLVVLKYTPVAGQPIKGLIGKGVCYDSGGLSIKTGNYMMGMKFDMSGAAVSMSLLYAMQKNKVQRNLYVLLPIVENLVDTISYKPDDVIISHSGLSVEITNTDAEGRLIMADALSYAAKELKVESLISIATLTGAIGYALGNQYTGIWSTEESEWKALEKALSKSGEKGWRMPLHKFFLKGLKSPIADIANSAKTGAGGASRAAMFLKEFTHSKPYIHLDIAGVAHADNVHIAQAPMLSTLYWYLSDC